MANTAQFLKRSFVAAIFATAISVVACRQMPPPAADTLRYNLENEPTALNPLLVADAYAGEVLSYVSDTLLKFDPDNLKLVPNLADRFEISTDKLSYTFHIRDNANWHDGKPVTADDVLFSFKTVQDPNNQSPFQISFSDVESIEKLDEKTFRLKAKTINAFGLQNYAGLPIVPKHLWQNEKNLAASNLSRQPIGDGPYRFSTWESGNRIILERNESYWGKKPGIKRIEFYFISDPSVALQALKKGDLDLTSLREIQFARQTDTPAFREQFEKFATPGSVYRYIGWNLKSPIFSDGRVRKAMTMLLNRDAIAKKLTFGLMAAMTGPFHVNSPQYDSTIPLLPFDPAGAKKLLAEAGWSDSDHDGLLDKNGKPLRFRIYYPSSAPIFGRIVTIFKEDLRRVGIDMQIEQEDFGALLDRLNRKDFDAYTLAWQSSIKGVDPSSLWYSSQANVPNGLNYISFINTEVDRLLDEARVEFDDNKRNALYHDFHRIIAAEQPYTFVGATMDLNAVSKRFSNLIVHKTGLDLRDWVPAKTGAQQ